MPAVRTKDVFVLGAGFSRAAGVPTQAEILPGILRMDDSGLPRDEANEFRRSKEMLEALLSDTMFLDINNPNDIIDLEDIYTPLDYCISHSVAFRNIAPTIAIEYRRALDFLVTLFMSKNLQNHRLNKGFIDEFARYLVGLKSSKNDDSLSIITTNWDLLIDNSLNRAIRSLNKKCILDYCCHTTPYKKHENSMPALLARGKGYSNVKLLKLHGSLNWLFCTRCGRLYATHGEKISAEEYLIRPTCRLCARNYSNPDSSDSGAPLVSHLLMPTYVKNLNNIQIGLVWQNASIELAEANRILFIGYSFPTADFELRRLFSCNVRHSSEISVIQREQSDTGLEDRYQRFFGKRIVKFNYEGAEQFLRKYVSNGT